MATLKTVLHPKINKEGEKLYRLALRVTANRKISYLHLGYNVDPSDWDPEAEKIKKSHPKYSHLNRLIRKKYDQLEDVIFESKSSKTPLSARQIIDAIRERKKSKTFFDFADEHVSDLRRAGKHNRAISDNSKINRIEEYLGNRNLSFQDIDEAMLKKMKTYLKANKDLSERSVMNIFVLIRLLFNAAIRAEVVEQKYYPFGVGRVRIKYPDSKKIGLNKDEILSIEQLELDEGTPIWHTRNVFLFSFYLAGIRISDVLRMKWGDIVEDRLHYQMGKNDKIDSLMLPLKAISIINQYDKGKKSKSSFIFPELKGVDQKDSKAMYSRLKTGTKKINKYLKEIGEMAEIKKTITSHIARHSFGHIAGDQVSPQMLQKLYRHSHLSTTIGYQSNFDHTKTDEALNNVLNF
ncbi:site-specific integrase [uncultured Aquimarina sp.]|uniref:site-specific integrase n=1 Tax=uncultured Aquimarina sp. TaxID=575652 RepID=UPI0026389F60|nr:site-specific integrase [uncultured Aquimarina sp.]